MSRLISNMLKIKYTLHNHWEYLSKSTNDFHIDNCQLRLMSMNTLRRKVSSVGFFFLLLSNRTKREKKNRCPIA